MWFVVILFCLCMPSLLCAYWFVIGCNLDLGVSGDGIFGFCGLVFGIVLHPFACLLGVFVGWCVLLWTWWFSLLCF